VVVVMQNFIFRFAGHLLPPCWEFAPLCGCHALSVT
jgi:hypothetical protein